MRNNVIGESSYAIDKAVNILKEGGLVSIKAETVYGLACDPENPCAIKKLYKLKDRPQTNPLIIHVSSIEMLEEFAEINEVAKKLAKAFWPGPLTLILPKKKNKIISDMAVSNLKTVAVRMPSSIVFLKVIKKIGKPLAAPSANQSGYVSSTMASHVQESFGLKVSMIIDSGQSEYGLESTIVDLTEKNAVIRRLGIIDSKSIANVIGSKIFYSQNNKNSKPNSPGQLLKHYSPKTPVELNVKMPRDGDAFLGFGKYNFSHEPSLNLSINGNLNEAAFNLFNFLRKLDKLNRNKISVYPIPKKGIGKVINERLKRAENK